MSVFASYAICKVAKDAAGIAGNFLSLSLTFSDSQLSQIFLLILIKKHTFLSGIFLILKKKLIFLSGIFFI
jgi:hypothetical protein